MGEYEENKGFDVVWDHIPHISHYQVFLLVIVFGVNISGGIWTLWSIFGLYRPTSYRCHNILDDYPTNITFEEKRQLLGVADDARCKFYEIDELDFSMCLEDYDYINCSIELKSDNRISQCIHYEFDDDFITNNGLYSAVVEYNLFCDKEIISTIITSLTFVGYFIGAALAGILSDRYGRKKITMISLLLLSIIGSLLRFMPNWWSFMTLWVALHVANHVVSIASTVYAVEVVGPSKRHFGQMASAGFGLGAVLIAPIAKMWPNWKDMSSCCGLVTVLCLIVSICLTRSPRWVCLYSNSDEGRELIQNFALKTKSAIPNSIYEHFRILSKNVGQKKVFTIVDIIQSNYFRIIGLLIGYIFFTSSMTYYGLSLNASSLPGNLFVNTVMNGAAEMLAYLIITLAMPFIGRSVLTSGTLFLGGCIFLSNGVMLQFADGDAGIITGVQWMSFLGKFLISGTFGLIFIYVAELYPTSIRSVGTGFASMCARIAGIATPYIILLQTRGVWIPPVIFGVFSILAGIAATFLPETLNAPIFQTIEEAEENNKKNIAKKIDLSVL